MEDKEYIELNEERAMIYLPSNAVEVKITATVYVNGSIENVEKVMSIAEIRRAFDDAEENYIEDDDCFVLTDKGKKYLEQLKQE